MADREHLSILRQGIKDWNSWRQRSPRIRPDLRDADLRDFELSAEHPQRRPRGADLRDADLRGASLPANLSHTNLRGADLREAILQDALLLGAGFFPPSPEVSIRGANLQGADLRRACVPPGASLGDTDLRDARLAGATLDCADFTSANGSQSVTIHARLPRAKRSSTFHRNLKLPERNMK